MEDVTFLEVSDNIATSRADTYIAALPSVANDTNSVPSTPVSVSNAIQVESFISDTSAPLLTDFTFNLNNGELVLTFNDAVVTSTLDVESYYISK